MHQENPNDEVLEVNRTHYYGFSDTKKRRIA
jgi:hypothetical protein